MKQTAPDAMLVQDTGLLVRAILVAPVAQSL